MNHYVNIFEGKGLLKESQHTGRELLLYMMFIYFEEINVRPNILLKNLTVV